MKNVEEPHSLIEAKLTNQKNPNFKSSNVFLPLFLSFGCRVDFVIYDFAYSSTQRSFPIAISLIILSIRFKFL